MTGYSVLLFLHVSGAILIFSGIAALIFGVAAIRLASTVDQVRAIARPMLVGRKIGLEHISVIDVVTMIGIVLTAATGLYMATNWGFGRGWVEAAIASFALMAPVGPLVINPRLQAIGRAAEAASSGPPDGNLLKLMHDPLLTGALLSLTAWLLGIVSLMTIKPSLAAAVIAMLVALGLGLAASLSVWRLDRPGRFQKKSDALTAGRP
jgi:ABC-type spermidine/putrescine transport system permease subunit II